MTFYGYIRVSTSRQGERGVSLGEQREAIERYAARNGLTISRWFEERETAAKLGRREWAEMLKLLRRKKADGVLIHKIDRSARNLRDWADLGALIDRGVEVHFVNESLDLRSRGGRLSADIQAVVAADYIRNLREEALKGITGRLKQGVLPLPAPLGYLDRGAGKPKAIDPMKGPLVRKAFELYATGRYSLRTLRTAVEASGLRNRCGRTVSVNSLSKILRNPFYAGLIRVKCRNEIYQGAHEPLVSRSLFNRVQAVLDGKLAPRSKRHEFLFQRRIRCRGCGYSLVGERQKGFVYYRCHSRSCPTTCVKEETAEGTLRPLLEALRLSPEERTYLEEKIETLKTTWQDELTVQRRALKLQIQQIKERCGRLTDALIDGLLDRDLFEERKQSLLAEKQGLEEKLAALDDDGGMGPRRLADFLERLDCAYLLYESGTFDEKRDTVDLFTSNWWVTGKRLGFTTLPEVKLVAERRGVFRCGAYRDDPRTCTRSRVRGQSQTARTWDQIIGAILRSDVMLNLPHRCSGMPWQPIARTIPAKPPKTPSE